MSPRKIKKKLLEERKKCVSLQKERRTIKQHERRVTIRVTHLKNIIYRLKKKKIIKVDLAKELEKTFSGVPLAIMKRMIANSLKGKSTRQKYSATLRSFAMTLQFYNCKAYEYVRKTFNMALPSQSVIRSWMANVECEPGFSEAAFVSLKLKVEENTSENKATICSLMLDEMCIKKQIDFANNKSWGYVNLGIEPDTDELEPATEALVFMVVSINSHWKLPIGYFFIKSLKASEKAQLVREALRKLKQCNVIITSLTCDGPNVNFAMMNELGAEVTDLKNIIPSFQHPSDGSKIFVLFDPCHMLKILRNNWANMKKLIDPYEEVVDFDLINQLYNIQKDENFRLGTKLRKTHIEWQRQKMKVNVKFFLSA